MGGLNPLLTPYPLSVLDQLGNRSNRCILLYTRIWLGFGLRDRSRDGGEGDIGWFASQFRFIRFRDDLCFHLRIRLGLGFGIGFDLDGSGSSSTFRSRLMSVYRSNEFRIDIDIDILRGACRGRRYFYPNSIWSSIQFTKKSRGDILNFDGVTISPLANTLIKFSICSNLVSFSVTSYWSWRTWVRREWVVVVFSYCQSLSSLFFSSNLILFSSHFFVPALRRGSGMWSG